MPAAKRIFSFPGKRERAALRKESIMNEHKRIFTSESVTEGHPDKICDQISDGVLDAILAQDPQARVACECATTTGLVLVMGEITTSCYVDIAGIARNTITRIGYDNAECGFDGRSCSVLTAIDKQSADIAMGVDTSYDDAAQTGAGDQGMMFGFACNETKELMPAPISYAHNLTRALTAERKSGKLPWLRPDGKSQVTVEYDENGKPIQNAFVDRNNDGQITEADRYLTHKSPMAKVYMGFSSQFSYKKWDLGFNLRANFGNYVYNGVASGNSTSNNYGGKGFITNLYNGFQDTGFTLLNTSEQMASDYFLENASFLKMDNLTLGYSFQNLFAAKLSGRISASVQNVFTISKYSGLDPECGAIDSNIWPRPRTYTIGLNLNF